MVKDLDLTRSAYTKCPVINLGEDMDRDCQESLTQDNHVLKLYGGETSQQGEVDIRAPITDGLEAEEPDWREVASRLQAEVANQERKIQALLKNNGHENSESPHAI